MQVEFESESVREFFSSLGRYPTIEEAEKLRLLNLATSENSLSIEIQTLTRDHAAALSAEIQAPSRYNGPPSSTGKKK